MMNLLASMVGLLVWALQPGADGKNILMMESFIAGSHYQYLSLLGNVLVLVQDNLVPYLVPTVDPGREKDFATLIGTELAGRGHNVTVLVGNSVRNNIDTANHESIFNFQYFDDGVPADSYREIVEFFARKSLTGETSSVVWSAKLWLGLLDEPITETIRNNIQILTKNFLRNGNLHDSLKRGKYDLVICDIMSPMCSIAAHDILRLKYVNIANGGFLGTRYSRWMNNPSPLSYVPEYLTHFEDSMSFPQRVKNLLLHIVSVAIYDFGILSMYDSLRTECGLSKSAVSVREILGQSSLFILNWDFVLEYPRPVQPNVILAGGVSVKPAEPLSQDLEEFVRCSGDAGVVVFSFSTLVKVMDGEMVDMIASALARVPLRVVWKFNGDRRPSTFSNNTLLTSWLPQGDLLGHEKTKVFAYHGGINGAYEAIYHGVPVVGVPMFADQADDLLRLRSLGMAEYLEEGIRGLNSDSLYQIIMKVASNPSYKEKAVEASKRFRSQPRQQPVKHAVFWIEHVLRNGDSHLRTRAGQMSWIQRNSLDVAGILFIICFLLGWDLCLIFAAIFRRVKRVFLPKTGSP